jgi:hypothetical protein
MLRDIDLAVDQLQQITISSYHNKCPGKTTHSPSTLKEQEPEWAESLNKKAFTCSIKGIRKAKLVIITQALLGHHRCTRWCLIQEDHDKRGNQQS